MEGVWGGGNGCLYFRNDWGTKIERIVEQKKCGWEQNHALSFGTQGIVFCLYWINL